MIPAPLPSAGMPTTLLALLTGVTVALGVLALATMARPASRPLGRLERRSRATAEDNRQKPRSGKGEPTSLRRSDIPGLLPSHPAWLARLLPRAHALRGKLDRAEIPLRVADFLLLCCLAGAIGGSGGHLLWGWSLWQAAAVGIVVATLCPAFLLRRRIARRERRFLAQLPEALDLVVRAIRSGLPVTEALNNISGEMREPARGIFSGLCANIRIGMSLGDALSLAAERIQLQEFRFFAISLVIQQETGGNLAEILQNLSTMLRRRYQVRLKIKAMSSEARASALIIGALPFLTGAAIYWINPSYIEKLFTDPRGWLLLAMGGSSLVMGLLVMSKMTRFEV